MTELLGLPGWSGIFGAVVISVTVYALVRMLLLAQRQEAGGCEELPLLNFTPGSYEVRHMPMKSFDLSDRKNLARSVKVVSTEVLPSVCMHGGRLTDLGNGRSVLLVEDNEFNCDLAEELLSALGVYVTVAVNGRECVEGVAAEPFDLVLMDIQMPLMDGLTAARAIRADGRFDGLPIVALTGRSMTGDREGSLSAGMNDHLTKPIDPDMLSDMLIRWLPERLTSRAQLKSQITTPPGLNEKLPALLPPFDIQAALVRANGKPELLRRMMLRFRDLYEQSGHELRTMIDGGRIEEAHRFAHSLKGVASTLEAHTLAACAAAIEYALRDGMMGVVPRLIQAMDTALAPAIAAAATLEVATVELPSLERQIVSLPFVSKGSSRAPLTAGGQSRSSHSHSW